MGLGDLRGPQPFSHQLPPWPPAALPHLLLGGESRRSPLRAVTGPGAEPTLAAVLGPGGPESGSSGETGVRQASSHCTQDPQASSHCTQDPQASSHCTQDLPAHFLSPHSLLTHSVPTVGTRRQSRVASRVAHGGAEGMGVQRVMPASEVLLEDFLEEGAKASEQGSCCPGEGRAGPAKRGTRLSFLFLSVCSVPSPYGPVCLSSVFFPCRSAPSFSLRCPLVPPPLTPLTPTLSLCSVLRGLARRPPLRPSCSPGPGPLAGAGGPGRRPLLPQLTPPCSVRVSLLGPPGRSSTCIFQRPVPPALTATQPLGTPVPCPQLPREPPAEGVAGKVGSPGEEAAGLGGGGFLRWGERARRGLAREGR